MCVALMIIAYLIYILINYQLISIKIYFSKRDCFRIPIHCDPHPQAPYQKYEKNYVKVFNKNQTYLDLQFIKCPVLLKENFLADFKSAKVIFSTELSDLICDKVKNNKASFSLDVEEYLFNYIIENFRNLERKC